MALSPANARGIQDIESAILVVSLDDTTPKGEDERAWMYWSGGKNEKGQEHGRNRWFDKHGIVVDEAGESGFNGERESFYADLDPRAFSVSAVGAGTRPSERYRGWKDRARENAGRRRTRARKTPCPDHHLRMNNTDKCQRAEEQAATDEVLRTLDAGRVLVAGRST